MVNTKIVLLRNNKDSLNISGIRAFNMVELLNFFGRLNLWTFIVIWTSTIFLIIFILLLLFSVNQLDKEAIKLSIKAKRLMGALSEKTSKLVDNDN